MSRAHGHQAGSEPCSGDCTYRRLYEGSQRSLNEMASLQASALARAGRLRAGIVTMLRQHFPAPFAAAERESGRRVSEVDDELLLAYLSGFMQHHRPAPPAPAASTPATAEALAAIASAMAALGVVLPADDLNAWPALLGQLVAAAAAQPGQGGGSDPATGPGSAAALPGRPGTRRLIPLEDLFGLEDGLAAPSRWEGDLGLADPSEGWSPSPIAPTQHPQSTPGAPAAVPPFEPREAASLPGVDGPLRPQLFPAPRKKAPRRQPGSLRTRAIPAGEPDLDVPAANAEDRLELESGTHDQLLAAVCIPRPVFARDLVEVVGSREVVEEWESQCKADPARFPVRFVAAKARHRLRGSLVLPVAPALTEVLTSSAWLRCVDAYRAARVYEMGVLLHRVSSEVVSADFGEHSAVLRLSTQRGLVGIVVVFDPDDAAGSPGFTALRDAVSQLSTERLSLLALLTTAGEERAVPALGSAAALAATQLSWSPAFPVIASRTWEYADDRGSSAVLVLDARARPAS